MVEDREWNPSNKLLSRKTRGMSLIERIEAACGYWDRVGKPTWGEHFGGVDLDLDAKRRARIDKEQARSQRRILRSIIE